MMARYIDAEEITRRILYFYHHTNNGSGEHYAYATALSQIDHTPTADVEEVKHGYWIEYSDDPSIITCSECDWGEHPMINKIYNRCPMCGAKMDGRSDT